LQTFGLRPSGFKGALIGSFLRPQWRVKVVS
jgi:hypothetical protein